ncbi:hypothetical protein [Rhodoflexus sp.]
MSRQPEKYQVFEKENEILRHSKDLLARPELLSDQSWQQEYEQLVQSYAQLLGEVKLLTSVSDRLQSKLNKANEGITRKNEELAQTLDMLVRERVSKRATAIVLVLAALFFVVSELFIDPRIEENVTILGLSGVIVLKIVAVVMLKPIEIVLENLLLKTAAPKKL